MEHGIRDPILILALRLSPVIPFVCTMNIATKPVVYRGGLVSFRIPENWREEYDPEGGGTFYEDKPDSGTLRLNVLSFEKKTALTLKDATRELFAGQPHEVLPCGLPMRHYVKETEERGTALRLYRWEVLIPVSPKQWRLACFTHTITAAQDETAQSQEELRLVNSIVREARYSTQPAFPPKRPWWRFWS